MGKIPFGPISHVKTLRVLDLSKNRVEKIEDPFFTIESLKLDQLYLMDNNIETLPTNSFANFEFINYTTLSGNPLRIIEEEAFKVACPQFSKQVQKVLINETGLIYSYVHIKSLLGLFLKGNGYFLKWCM